MGVRIDIRINGQSLDLPPGANDSFFITKQIHNILQGLETREGDFSRSISLPKTAKNLELTGAAVPINYERANEDFLNCEVLFDGIPVVNDGRFLVTSVSRHNISARIFGGNSDFFSQLSGEPLSDLDLSEYDFELTSAGIADHSENTSGSVAPWANWTDNLSYRKMIEAGGNPSDFNLQYPNIQWSGFFFYIDTLLKEIFDNLNGLTVDRSGLDDLFKSLAMALPVRRFVEGWEIPDGFNAIGTRETTQSVLNATPVILIPTVFQDPGGIWTGDGWTVPNSGLISFAVQIRAYNPNQFIYANAELQFTKNGVVFASEEYSVFPRGFEDIEYISSVTANAGDVIRAQIQLIGGQIIAHDITRQTQEIKQVGNNPSRVFLVSNEMPEMTQREFVINVFKWFNIIATTQNKTVKLSYWDDIVTRPPVLIKKNATRDFDATEVLQNYGQRNVFKYADNKLLEREDTAGNFTINSNVLPPSKVVVQLKFSASDENQIPGTPSGVVSMPLYDYEYRNVNNNLMNTSGTGFSTVDAHGLRPGDLVKLPNILVQVATIINSKNGTFTTSAGNQNNQNWQTIHIEITGDGVHVAKMELVTTPPIYYPDGPTLGVSRGAAMAARFVPELLFSQIVNNYFGSLQRVLRSPAIIELWLNIEVGEFISLDQTRPIYIESLGQNFYINRIDQYKIEGLTRFQLIKF